MIVNQMYMYMYIMQLHTQASHSDFILQPHCEIKSGWEAWVRGYIILVYAHTRKNMTLVTYTPA